LTTAPPRSLAADNAALPSGEANTFSESVTSKDNNKEKANSNGHHSGHFKRLIQSQLQEKISRGECFRCEEKYSVNHVFKNKQLSTMILIEGHEEKEHKNE